MDVEVMYPEIVRKLAQRLHDKLYSLRRIADLLNVSKSVVHKWLHLRKEGIKASACKDKEETECLRKVVIAKPHLSVRGYQHYLRSLNINVSHTTVFNWLRGILKFSNRRTYPILPPRCPVEIHMKRQVFACTLQTINPSTVVAVDETSLYDKPLVKRCWAPRYERVQMNVTRSGSRYTLIAAMSSSQVVRQHLVKGSLNAKLFTDFILSTDFPPNARYVLLDNVAFHHTTIVKEALASRGLQPLYTSPYSPDYNPVELYFSWIKRTLMAGRDLHAKATSLLTKQAPQQFCQNWFRHAWNFRYNVNNVTCANNNALSIMPPGA
jgi:transposase/predicted transcriptional regulator